jgi:CTP synthase (UTP-ammonia lyase)
MTTARIVIIGDFDPTYPLHLATNESIEHAARALRVHIEAQWLPTS